MSSKDLSTAVGRLVEVATGDGDDRALRTAVNAVVKAFDPADAKAAKSAITKIGDGARTADGRAAQVLQLTLGALVEAGASPELAWPIVSAGLAELLGAATRFADACLERAKNESGDEGFAMAAMEVASRRPREAAAWREAPSRSLAAVACLTRSLDLRTAARAEKKLLTAAEPLADAIDEVGLLLEALRVLDGDTIRVTEEESGKTFRVVAHEVATNAELLVLLADALAEPLGTPRPDAKAVAAVTGGNAKKTKLAIAYADEVIDGIPADLPAKNGERLVTIQILDKPATLDVQTAFPALSPRVELAGGSKAKPGKAARPPTRSPKRR
jgi:hypothetical protein